ncbi:unnamed protein product [Prorocentrum cordatum]|uniref:ATP-sulfurylase PUA-like domain-containing protein n=1 Tax=Prorocentrum cordatum TaxID=2364126 RepID=A0ABN9TD31_9DINO|nr:unnamed protein product [Polarella glacialis]
MLVVSVARPVLQRTAYAQRAWRLLSTAAVGRHLPTDGKQAVSGCLAGASGGKQERGIRTCTTTAGSPHGGALVDLMVKDAAKAKQLVAACVKDIELNERQACDVFCLLNGAFSPLKGFMDETTYTSVVKDMRLPEKQLFGLPVIRDVSDTAGFKAGDKVLLKWKGEGVAVLEASSIYKPDKTVEAMNVYGTSSLEHPTVHALVQDVGKYYVGGNLHGIKSPAFPYPVQAPSEAHGISFCFFRLALLFLLLSRLRALPRAAAAVAPLLYSAPTSIPHLPRPFEK